MATDLKEIPMPNKTDHLDDRTNPRDLLLYGAGIGFYAMRAANGRTEVPYASYELANDGEVSGMIMAFDLTRLDEQSKTAIKALKEHLDSQFK